MPEDQHLANVLVIDDEDSLREACTRVLTRRGYRVHTAMDGEAGLEAIASLQPELVLLDLMMPEMGGMAVLDELRRLSPGSKCVVVTAYATVSTTREALRHGAADFLAKPFSPDELCSVVERTLAGRTYCLEATTQENLIDTISQVIEDLNTLGDELQDHPDQGQRARQAARRLESIVSCLRSADQPE